MSTPKGREVGIRAIQWRFVMKDPVALLVWFIIAVALLGGLGMTRIRNVLRKLWRGKR